MPQTFIQDAFKAGKVLVSNPRWGHAAALFGTDGQNYLFKDSGPGFLIKEYCRIKFSTTNLFFKFGV